jgi:ABC-type branched-subunit amino acid transport system substrate-binding protein
LALHEAGPKKAIGEDKQVLTFWRKIHAGKAARNTWRQRAGFLAAGATALVLAACGGTVAHNPLQSAANPTIQGPASQDVGKTENVDPVAQAKTKIAAASAERVRQQKGVKVAVLLPLTGKGSSAKIAKALKQAGELAMFDFNNPNIVLTAKDTKGTPDGARAAAVDAVNSGAELIIGPLFSKNVKAAAPVARKASVPMVAFSSDQTVAGKGVYLLSFLAGQDVERIVTYAISNGKRRFGALIPDTPYGHLVEAAFKQSVERLGGEIVGLERYPTDPNGMLAPVEKIAELARTKTPVTEEQPEPQPIEPQIDALFMPSGAKVIPTLSPILPYYEVDTEAVKLIGTGSWDYHGVGREKPLMKAWYPGPDPKGWRNFTQRYTATYGKAPPRIASLAYDAVSLAVSLSKASPGQRYTSSRLTRNSGFAGVDGLFRLRSDGTCERGLAVLEIQKFGPRVIDRAPSVFTSARSASAGSMWPRF